MFKIFKKEKKQAETCGVCGMLEGKDFISRQGKKFCSEGCFKSYQKNKTDKDGKSSSCCG